MTEPFVDSFAAVGSGFGYTIGSDFPTRRVDYVYCRGGAVPVSCEVPDIRTSDHRPVITEIALATAHRD